MVDGIGAVGVYVTQRVVRQGGEMNDRVEASKVRPLDVADVDPQRGRVGGNLPKRAGAEQLAVEAGDVDVRGLEHGHQYRADIALMTRDQHFHRDVSLTKCPLVTPAPAVQETCTEAPGVRCSVRTSWPIAPR